MTDHTTVIDAIRAYGTIILVCLSDGTIVPFDHRMFFHMIEAEHGRLFDRPVSVEYDEEGGTSFHFEEEGE